ncbi:unnamed protein product [Phytomonas sp. EM1]|nr:unnamed protein product [Phytomonas sp. EM1]|eukprot:CCW63960.1 unnamed protein product [Phytomonas sp. isolate EM1]
MNETKKVVERRWNDLSRLQLELPEKTDKKNTKDPCECKGFVNGTVSDFDGKQLNMRSFQSTKSYLVLQEITKNDATLIPPKLLDYLVGMSSTYTCTPLGCTMRESTDYLIRELFRRLQTGQVWVALKVFYVFYQLLWRGSRSLIESAYALDIPFLSIDAIVKRIKITPQENISGAPLPCTLPCVVGGDNRPPHRNVPQHSGVMAESMQNATNTCKATTRRASGSSMNCLSPQCSKYSYPGNANACKEQTTWLYCTNEEYLSSCVSPEFTYNCLGYIGALCEYCYQHPEVDLANSRLLSTFATNAGIPELKELCEDTLELLQSTATLVVDVPVGCDLVISMLHTRLSDARVLYSIFCHALAMFLDASISKVIQVFNEYNMGLDISQLTHASEEGELRKYMNSFRTNGNIAGTSMSSLSSNTKCTCSLEFMYAWMCNSTLLKDWYNILHQLDRTVRMLQNVCEAVKADSGEALALANYTTRIPKELLARMSVLVRMTREELPCKNDDEGELTSMTDTSDPSSVVVRTGSDPPSTAAEPRGVVGAPSGAAAPSGSVVGVPSLSGGTDFKILKERLSYAKTTWTIQMKCLRGLFKADSSATPLLNTIEKKLAIYIDSLDAVCTKRYKTALSSGSSMGRRLLSGTAGLTENGTDKLGSISTPLFSLGDLRWPKQSDETSHANSLATRRVSLEDPLTSRAAGFSPHADLGRHGEESSGIFLASFEDHGANKGDASLANSSQEGTPHERESVGTAHLQPSRAYRFHSRGSEPTMSSVQTFVENDGTDAESCSMEVEVTPLTEDMTCTNASIQSLLEKDDVVVVCNEPLSTRDDGNMAERFHIIRAHAPIGEGSYSSVYRAWDELMGRYLAAKEVALDAKRLPAVVRGVLKEYMVLTSLRHPNIVHVVAFMIDGHSCKIFMEWMPSGSLRDVLRDSRSGALRESVVSRYVRDTLLGLGFLHSRGVLHRDVKPANMLLGTEGSVKLTDFGTSVLLSENEHTLESGVIMGTAPYMAPEVVRGVYSAASDVWSLGCTALELATGHVPWEDLGTGIRLNPVQLIYKIGKLSENDKPDLPHSYLRAARTEHADGAGAESDSRQKPVPVVSEDFLSFLDQIFVLDRHARATAAELLEHPFITKHHEEWKLRQVELEAVANRPNSEMHSKKEERTQ